MANNFFSEPPNILPFEGTGIGYKCKVKLAPRCGLIVPDEYELKLLASLVSSFFPLCTLHGIWIPCCSVSIHWQLRIHYTKEKNEITKFEESKYDRYQILRIGNGVGKQ